MERVLVLNNVKDGYMDPGYPGFLYTKHGRYEPQSTEKYPRGTLKKIPIMCCLASKMDHVIFEGFNKNESDPVKRRVVQLNKITPSSIEDIGAQSQIYIGGVFMNKKEITDLKKLYKKFENVMFIDEICTFLNDEIRVKAESIYKIISLVKMDGNTVLKLLIPPDFVNSKLRR